MSQLRLGVIGAGYLGRIHVRLANQLGGVRFMGVADPDPAARRRAAEEFGVATFADHRELAQQSDAVIVAAPTPLHTSIGLDLIGRGIHVLMEKPLASSAAQAAQLVRAATAKGVVLQVGHVERFNPALAAALPHVDQPKYIEAARHTPYTFRSTDVGVVLDLMIHDLDIILSLVGSTPASVDAFGFSVLSRHEDVAQARVVFDNGCVANVSASRISYAASRKMQVWTPNSFCCIDFAHRGSTVVRPSAEVAEGRFEEQALTAERKEHLKEHLFEELLVREEIAGEERNAIADEQQDFVDSIEQHRAPQVTGDDGLRRLELAERVLASMAAHRWDGVATGRAGPHGQEEQVVVRPPHWDAAHFSHSPRRAAG